MASFWQAFSCPNTGSTVRARSLQLPASKGIWMVGPDGIRDEDFGDDPEAISTAGLYPTIRAHSAAIRRAAAEEEIDLDAIDRVNEAFTRELSRKIDSTHEMIAATELSVASDDLVCSIGSLSQFPWEKSVDRVSTRAHICLEPASVDLARVLIDDPVLDQANVAIIGDDPDLTMAAEEIEALRAAYGARSKVITGTTAAAIEGAAAVTGILHITAHGIQEWRDPRENLPQFTEHQMTAKEVAELNLARVNLVVVNSCNAGALGINMNAGDATLAGAFIAAGAKAVIAALWEVEGSCAATFSAQLYTSLAAGMRVTDAFDQATQALRCLASSMTDGSSAFYSDPFRLTLRARGVPPP
jgi:CHAT domain